MTSFNFRGKSYPVLVESYTTTDAIKLSESIDNKFKDPKDDSRAAYVFTKLCPELAKDLPGVVAYNSEFSFLWGIELAEAIAFLSVLSGITMTRVADRSSDPATLHRKAREMGEQVEGLVEESNQVYAEALLERIREEEGTIDVRSQEVPKVTITPKTTKGKAIAPSDKASRKAKLLQEIQELEGSPDGE